MCTEPIPNAIAPDVHHRWYIHIREECWKICSAINAQHSCPSILATKGMQAFQYVAPHLANEPHQIAAPNTAPFQAQAPVGGVGSAGMPVVTAVAAASGLNVPPGDPAAGGVAVPSEEDDDIDVEDQADEDYKQQCFF